MREIERLRQRADRDGVTWVDRKKRAGLCRRNAQIGKARLGHIGNPSLSQREQIEEAIVHGLHN